MPVSKPYKVNEAILPSTEGRPQRVEVMVLDKVESHFNRCHTELVGTKEQYRKFESFHEFDSLGHSMVARIVQNNDRFVPPLRAPLVQMVTELGQEQSEGKGICYPRIHCIEELSVTA